MPPRKRAASAPKDEPAKTETPEDEADGQQAELSDEPAAPETQGDGDQAPADNDAEQDGGDKPDEKDGAPERSDLQDADLPCTECMPNGWPEGAFSVGCIHGTYVRKQK